MKTILLVFFSLTATLISSAQTTYFKKSTHGTHIHDYSLEAISARDGGFYTTGSDRDTESYNNPYIIKMDSMYNVQWRKRLTGNNWALSQFSILIQVHGGDLLAVAVTPYSAVVHPKSLIRFDENGNVKWVRSYDTYTRSIITSLTSDSINGHIKLGVVDELDDVQGIVELDSTGLILSNQLISLGGFVQGGCFPAPGGGFYFSGGDGTLGTDWDAYCGRVDAAGNIVWSHKEQPGYFFTRASLQPIPLPGGDILWNFSQSDLVTYGNNKYCISRLDNNGNFLWIKEFVPAVGDTLTQAAVTTTDDGTLILIASLKSPERTVICPIDDNANVQPGKLFDINLFQYYLYSKINAINGDMIIYSIQSATGNNVFIKTNWAETNCLESNYTITTAPATFTSNSIVLGSGVFDFLEDTTLSFSMVNQNFSDSMWCSNTGIFETKNGSKVSIYPNPASTQLSINLEGLQAEYANIYNVSGKLVIEAKHPDNNNIDISQLEQGFYIIEIKVGGETQRASWIKL